MTSSGTVTAFRMPRPARGPRARAGVASAHTGGATGGGLFLAWSDPVKSAGGGGGGVVHRLHWRSARRARDGGRDTQKHQNADRRERDHSGTTCHVYSG